MLFSSREIPSRKTPWYLNPVPCDPVKSQSRPNFPVQSRDGSIPSCTVPCYKKPFLSRPGESRDISIPPETKLRSREKPWYFVSRPKICTMMIEVSSELSEGLFYMHIECCRGCSWCSVVLLYWCVVAAAPVLLFLAAGVRHRVPDGQTCCWFIESDPSAFFSSSKRDLFLMHPLAILSHLRHRFACILLIGDYGHE